MRFVRRSKIENYFKNDKSVVQVGELLFVPPPLLSFIQISFSQKSAPSKKKLHPLERHETKKNDVKKIADASRRGEKDRELETADDRILLVMPPPFVCFWKMFGPVPRSPSGRSPSLCRWWRSAGVAGSAGAPTPRGSCRGVHRRKREPVRGLLAAPTCTHPPLAGCSVEACNLSLGIRGGKTEELALPSRRTIRCAERKNREKNLVTLKKKSWRRCTQLSSFRFDRFDRALKTLLSILCMQIEPSFIF